jgi:lysophospholipase L1-like esterase
MKPGIVAAVIALVVPTLASGGPSHAAGPTATSGAAEDARAPAAKTALYSIGRFDLRDPAGPRFSWPGSTIRASFTGTGIDVRLRDSGTNFFSVVIDGGSPTVLSTNRASVRYTLASNLAAGRHTVALSKRTEAMVGAVQFLGFLPHDGTLVDTAWPTRTRRIEFIGDSITCGYGDLGTDPAQHFSPDLEDETIAYGALTAQALDAEHTAIAYSGIGVLRDRRGSTTDQMPTRFERALANDSTSRQPHATPAPDVVVINLGTNDFALGDPGRAFEQAYVDFVRAVRASYPDAWIVCTISPSLTDAYPPGAMSRTKATEAIRAAVAEVSSGGDRHVTVFAFAEQQPRDGFGSDYHPSARTHRRMAEQLTAVLRALVGW